MCPRPLNIISLLDDRKAKVPKVLTMLKTMISHLLHLWLLPAYIFPYFSHVDLTLASNHSLSMSLATPNLHNPSCEMTLIVTRLNLKDLFKREATQILHQHQEQLITTQFDKFLTICHHQFTLDSWMNYSIIMPVEASG